MQICTPFVKGSSIFDDILLFQIFMMLMFLPISIIIFDILYLQSLRATGQRISKGTKTLCFFFLLYASGISFLSHKNFDINLFCSMNFQENICRRVNKMTTHYSAFSSKAETLIVKSSPCQFKVDKNLIGKNFELFNRFSQPTILARYLVKWGSKLHES